MVILTVDKTSTVPVYRQICDRIVGLVDSGALAPGDRLPPTRVLAQTTGLHRSSVLRAYGELWALGYLESRPGSYSTVRRRTRLPTARQAGDTGLIDWAAVSTATGRGACVDKTRLGRERDMHPGVIDFSRLSTDRRLIPTDDLRRCVKAALLEEGSELLDYGDVAGYGPLRETIARHMRVHGVGVSTDEVLVTSGAQHALDLVLRAFTRGGNRIAVESPTYSAALALFRLHGLDPVEIPMSPDGMNLDRLEQALGRHRPKLVYTIPSFHNPTGITTSQAHRERLLALCEAHGVPVVEDGFEEEMKYFGKAVLPIKSMDTRGVVIYVGTLSKVVFPGLRIGWIAAARECVDRLAAIQRVSCLAGNTVAQAAAARFCRSGLYDAHLRRVHKVYRRRMQTVLKELVEQMPRGVEWTRPSGGYTLWLRVSGDGPGEDTLHEQLVRDGVELSPGSLYSQIPPAVPSFRLSIACVSEAEITEGIKRLGGSLARAIRARSRPKGKGTRPQEEDSRSSELDRVCTRTSVSCSDGAA